MIWALWGADKANILQTPRATYRSGFGHFSWDHSPDSLLLALLGTFHLDETTQQPRELPQWYQSADGLYNTALPEDIIRVTKVCNVCVYIQQILIAH